MLWRRPLASVSRTHSPGCSGPRRTPDQVVSADMRCTLSRAARGAPAAQTPAAKARSTSAVTSTPKTLPSRVEEEVLRRPGPAASPGSAPRRTMSAGSARPGSRVRATALTGSQGRRSSGVASTRRLVDDRRSGVPGRVEHHDAAGLLLLGAAYGLGERQVVGDRERPAGQRRGPAATAAGGGPRADMIDAVAPLHRNAGDHEREHVVGDVGRRAAARTAERTGRPAPARRATRPPQPATIVPWCGLPVTFQTTARSTRPPSSGSPGTRLSTPTTRLAPARPADGQPEQAVGGHAASRPSDDQPDGERGQRPDHGDRRTPGPGCRGSPSISVTPPRKCRVIERDRQAVALRHQRVRGLVQQHREVEQHREREPGDVLPGRRGRAAACSIRGRQHDRDQRGDQQPRGAHQDVDAADLADPEGAGRTRGRRRRGSPASPGSAVEATPTRYRGVPTDLSARSPSWSRDEQRAPQRGAPRSAPASAPSSTASTCSARSPPAGPATS